MDLATDVKNGRNYQLYDLGLEPEEMQENDEVKAKIESLDKDFEQVLLLDHLDEGLVLMAENLCWSLKQVA